ncbi:glutamyl-tRNA(Gln) amidotransferase subunit B, mitochondrial-like [Pomacea canaliculata]|uniref:glutamyl-tRNA(Gln) amidotransferase subunit B, mitochondrial-like n=1 Tax=Pomacea canaliculata TaxID=400727 RepID=UPI000D73EB81|nr:glutamyl-tRNA(Gln) amidotransferase subunit B, mitochondrial-like [Pomacea canaliculata]
MLFICFVYLRPTTTSALLTSLANMAATIAKYALTSRTCTVCKRLHRSQFHTNSKLKNVVSTDCISTLPRKSEWKSVVGLEIHAQIATKSKLFSGASTQYGAPVNSQVSNFDAALPGTLPVLNRKCVEAGVLTALALGCTVNPISRFDRKHYFYADLPAGYQITQQRQPLAQNGRVDYPHHIKGAGHNSVMELRSCQILQLQLEQDSGKSLHNHCDNISLIDLNRAGVGLMELVTEPDLRDGEDAASFVQELQFILCEIGTCDGRMQEGSLRVDANISVHKPGQPFGVRTEVKNINSIRNVSKAIDFEIQRQIEILEAGGKIENETRSFDAQISKTVSMRDKEKVLDYRFMPEPNLPPLCLYKRESVPLGTDLDSVVIVEDVQACLKELPGETRKRITEIYDIPLGAASALVREDGLVHLFESLMKKPSRDKEAVINVLLNAFVGLLRAQNCKASECPIPLESLGEICDLVASKDISRAVLQKLLVVLFKSPQLGVTEILDREHWHIIKDRSIIEKTITEILDTNRALLKKVLKRRDESSNAIIGPVQKKLGGLADLQTIVEVLQDILDKRGRT